MPAFNHFDVISPIYDRIFGRGDKTPLIRLANLSPDLTVLDVGGGTGRVAAKFSGAVQSVQVVDSAPGMLRQALERGMVVVAAESERLPYDAEQFDRIIMVDALHHVEDQQRTLREMWRLVKRGGTIIIEEPDIHNLVVKFIALAEKLMLMRSHFLNPVRMVEMSAALPSSEVTLIRQKGIVWVIIQKTDKNVEGAENG